MLETFTDSNFAAEVLASDKLTVVDFWAPWCPPCLVVGKTLEEVAKTFGDKVKIGKVNADDNPNVAVDYAVTNMPVVLFIKNGQVVDKQVGNAPKSTYEKKIQQYL